jgi:hypothetical protein
MNAEAMADHRVTRLSPSRWWYRDTCNVSLWAAGERALMLETLLEVPRP